MPPESNDLSSLERAREKLYQPIVDRIRPATAGQAAAGRKRVPHDWGNDPLPLIRHQGRRKIKIASIFFASAFVFFLLSLAAVTYFFYFGGNSVSVNKVDVQIQGPTSIAAGDTVPLSLTITNGNPAELKDATLQVDFPQGTRSAANIQQNDPRYTSNLGTIASGATVVRSVKAIMFGSANQTLSVPILITYQINGSNATFQKKMTYTVKVSSTPLSVSVDTLAETVSGKPLTVSLNVRSNATVPLQNVVLQGNFPFGFTVASSSAPLTDGSNILIGTLAPGAQKTYTITGSLSGQQGDQRAFNFTVGTSDAPDNTAIKLPYMTQSATVAIVSPFLSTGISINGDNSQNLALSPGADQSVTVSYQNTLSTQVTNATIDIKLSGSAVDFGSVQAPANGFYDSNTHTIQFTPSTDSKLASLAPGASGEESFTFKTLPANAQLLDPHVTLTTSVAGTRVGQSNVPQQVNATVSQTAKVTTNVHIAAKTLHGTGPIPDAGPIPPKPGTRTTYNIELVASDDGNALAGASATLTLPPYVTYTGNTSGSGSFSYDSASHTVTWSLGSMSQGASADGYFQVVLTPSTSQSGAVPSLTSNVSFSGYDRYSGVQVSASAPSATTQLANTNPASNNGVVQ